MSATTFVRRCAALVAVTAIGMGVGATSAQASSYGPYLTLASPSLNERSAPSTSAAVVGSLAYHSTIYIACQTSGSNVGGSVIWDRLTNGAFISDYLTTPPGNLTWTSSIPRCGTTPPPAPTAAVGRTVSYNEGGSGQCTWWAIDRFHAF